MTPLHFAVWSNGHATVRALLSYGADPRTLDEYGLSALHRAAGFGAAASANSLLGSDTEVSNWLLD